MDLVYACYTQFFKTLVELKLRNVVISPGGRSAGLAIIAERNPSLRTWIQHDERTAGFFALGLAKAEQAKENQQQEFVALICTSGTATANYLPALIEAYYSAVPLLVLTADRPPIFRGKGYPQTIFQPQIYGKYVGWEYEMPLVKRKTNYTQQAQMRIKRTGEKIAERIAKKLKNLQRPIHINCPFEEPLEEIQTPQNIQAKGKLQLEEEKVDAKKSAVKRFLLSRQLHHQAKKIARMIYKNPRGLILVGPQNYNAATKAALLELSEISGWPVLADGASSLRCQKSENVVSTGNFLLATEHYLKNTPDAVLRLGPTPTSKTINAQLNQNPPKHFYWCDPANQNFHADFFKQGRLAYPNLEELLTAVIKILKNLKLALDGSEPEWLQLWQNADAKASEIIHKELDSTPNITEPKVSHQLIKSLLSSKDTVVANVVLANSFAIRDFDSFGIFQPLEEMQKNVEVFCNRGASGIDGLVATALGISTGSSVTQKTPTFLLVGDTAVLHDLSSLLCAERLQIPLNIIILNNNGGGIFNTLSLAKELDVPIFKRLFIAPTEMGNFEFLDSFPGVELTQVQTPDQLVSFINSAEKINNVGKPSVLRIANVATSSDESALLRQKIKQGIKELFEAT